MKIGLFAVVVGALLAPSDVVAEESIDIGSRLELFVDDFLIGELKGDAQQFVHQPQPREVVLGDGRALGRQHVRVLLDLPRRRRLPDVPTTERRTLM